uniref:Aprataxin n=1 Tax=Petromyzon marinus TaxID=7757 RepID=S4RVN0_PETMA
VCACVMVRCAMQTCWLVSGDSRHEPIALPDGTTVVVGRCRLTRIKDTRCSRQQISVQAMYSKRVVLIKQLGVNPTSIETVELGHHGEAELRPGQTLHVVNASYPMHVEFRGPASPPPSEVPEIRRREGPREGQLPERLANQGERAEESDRPAGASPARAYHTSSDEQPGQPAHWSQSLRDAMDDPSVQIFRDDQVVVILDKFPKARHHWLVLPWRFVANVGVLRADHLPLLRHMHDVAERLSRQVQPLGAATAPPTFRLGYHAIPSMSRIHMHVISQDFDSPRLKTKKHWNSFTTGYFIDSEVVMRMVEEDGRVVIPEDTAELLKKPLQCHMCHREISTIPKLKEHLGTHK